MPDDKNKARGWWVPSKRVPVRILDVMVIAAGAAAAMLLVLTIVGFSMASKRADDLDTATKALIKADNDMAALRESKSAEIGKKGAALDAAKVEIAILEARPTKEILDTAKAEAASLRSRLGDASAAIRARERELADSKAEIADLKRQGDALKKSMSTTDRSKREFYEKVQELSGMLRKETVRLNDTKQKLRLANDRLAEAQANGRRLEADLADTRATLAKREARIESLEMEFGDIPIIPLTEDLAKIRWEEIQKDVASRKGREDRIDLLFRAKLVLAGTSFESYANRSWTRERQERQASLEREAAVVYNNVAGKIKSTPDAHAENLRLLSEALPKVEGSRYEDRIVKMIVREKTYVGGE